MDTPERPQLLHEAVLQSLEQAMALVRARGVCSKCRRMHPCGGMCKAARGICPQVRIKKGQEFHLVSNRLHVPLVQMTCDHQCLLMCLLKQASGDTGRSLLGRRG